MSVTDIISGGNRCSNLLFCLSGISSTFQTCETGASRGNLYDEIVDARSRHAGIATILNLKLNIATRFEMFACYRPLFWMVKSCPHIYNFAEVSSRRCDSSEQMIVVAPKSSSHSHVSVSTHCGQSGSDGTETQPRRNRTRVPPFQAPTAYDAESSGLQTTAIPERWKILAWRVI